MVVSSKNKEQLFQQPDSLPEAELVHLWYLAYILFPNSSQREYLVLCAHLISLVDVVQWSIKPKSLSSPRKCISPILSIGVYKNSSILEPVPIKELGLLL